MFEDVIQNIYEVQIVLSTSSLNTSSQVFEAYVLWIQKVVA